MKEHVLYRSKRDKTKCNNIMFAHINMTDRHLFRTPGEQALFEGKMREVTRQMIRHYWRRMDKRTRERARKTLSYIAEKQSPGLKL